MEHNCKMTLSWYVTVSLTISMKWNGQFENFVKCYGNFGNFYKMKQSVWHFYQIWQSVWQLSWNVRSKKKNYIFFFINKYSLCNIGSYNLGSFTGIMHRNLLLLFFNVTIVRENNIEQMIKYISLNCLKKFILWK